MPEDLGLHVSPGVVRKGWEIGQMEDGVRPSEDGEPDVFLSHSYTDNCRRLDMAVFECDCPNSLVCCSHAYAAVVALPHYRHRAALLWTLRNSLEEHGGGAGFEAVRASVKASLMGRLPLDDLADASIDAAIGLWTRVDWLKKNRAPKMAKYWSQHVERALKQLGAKIGANATDVNKVDAAKGAGPAAQKRLADFIKKMNMKDADLGPLLLALGKGSCGQAGQAGKPGNWEQLSQSLWSFVAGASAEADAAGKQGGASTAADDVREAVLVAMADAPTEFPGWDDLPFVHKLTHIESLVLKGLGAGSFQELSVPAPSAGRPAAAAPAPKARAAGQQPGAAKKDGAASYYSSFLAFLADWENAPEELMGQAGAGGGGAGPGPALLEGEAIGLLEELGRESLQGAGDEEILAALVNQHFGQRGEAGDWLEVAKRAIHAPRVDEESLWRQTAMQSAACSCWTPAGGLDDAAMARRLDFLAAEGWESAAARLISGAPPLAELRAWLLWEHIFEPQLGSLRSFLRRTGTGVGIVCFELPSGEIIKLDAAAGTVEAFEAALAGHDAPRAVEALLAFSHGCGSLRMAPLGDTFGAAYKSAAAATAAEAEGGFSALVGEMLSCLPSHFAHSASLVRFLLQPLSQDAGAGEVISRVAGSMRAQCAAMLCPSGWVLARGLSEQLVGRLAASETSAFRQPQPSHRRRPPPNPQPPAAAAGVASQQAGTPVCDANDAQVVSQNGAAAQPVVLPAAPATQSPGSLPSDPAEALIAEIRRQEFGFEGEQEPAGELQRKQNARLARALKRLAGELYGSDVHWQLELMQNADDNTYEEDLEPTAEFRLLDGEVVFRCNETGFREGDIRAICDIGNSSKVGKAKYAAGGRVVATGEKGLGFKAVFALTNRPSIFSGPYRLCFDAMHRSGIGYVLPAWLAGSTSAEELGTLLEGGWGSALKMPLRPDLLPRQEELFTRLAELPPSSLLFLKKLRDVAIIDESMGGNGSSSIHMRRADELADPDSRWQEQTARVVIEVSRADGPWERESWLLLRRNFTVPEGVAKPGISEPPATTLVEIALPLDGDGAFDATRGAQPVFAFLPVRSFGLSFALQADWAVSSSREELLSGCAWNEFLKAQLPKLLIEMVEEVKKEPAESPLRWSFYAAIPALASTQPFFRSAIAQLSAALRQHDCMLTDDGVFCVPRLAYRCPAEVREAMRPTPPTPGEPAALSPLRRALQAQGMHLLSEMLESQVPSGLLESLGVQRFGAAQLMKLLPLAAESRPCLAWWRRVLALLDELLDAGARTDLPRLLEVARGLPLLPLEGGLWCAANAGVFLPPAADEAKGFPRKLLAELRAVDPELLADQGGEDSLIVARVRKLLRRLEVPPLTPRQVLRDVVAPMFKSFAAPGTIAADAAPRSIKVLVTFAAFLATHADLAEELKSAAVGWPTADLSEVAIGRRFTAPALHSPRAAGFLQALQGSPLGARLPAPPRGFAEAEALGEVLERMGLATPGPLVLASEAGDWQCPEFLALLSCIAKESASDGRRRAGLLARAFNVAWQFYERYTKREDGSPSSFLQALRERRWLPADDNAESKEDGEQLKDGEHASLLRPSDLCISTPALRAVFTESSLLAGRLTAAVSGRFADALGVVQEPSVQLAISILRSFRQKSPVGPQVAASLYGYLEKEGADLVPLRGAASVVVAAAEALQPPCDVVWEDETGACGLPALLPLYSTRWRAFFVTGLGVPERPTSHQMLRRIDVLTASPDADLDDIWALLLFVGGRLAECAGGVGSAAPGSEEAAEWSKTAEALRPRRCLPLAGGGLGVPAQGVLYADDCPRLPQRFLEAVQSSALFAASPPSTGRAQAAWPPLLRALGLRPLSEACSVLARHGASGSGAAGAPLRQRSPSLEADVGALLPLAQRYMFHKHRSVHDAVSAAVATRIRDLRIRQVEKPLQLQCALAPQNGGAADLTQLLDVDAFLEDSGAPGCEAGLQLLAVASCQMPAICVQLARLLVPPAVAAGGDEKAVAAARHAREALTTFLTSAAAGGGQALLDALGIGEAPEEASRWPRPAEAAAKADEAAALAAAAAAKASDAAGSEDTASEADAADGERPAKKPRVTLQDDGEPVFDDGLGGGTSDGVNTMGGGGAPGDGKGKGKDWLESGEKGGGGKKGGKGGEGDRGKWDGDMDLDPAGDRGSAAEGEGKGKGKDGKGKGKDGEGKGKGKGKGKGGEDRPAWDVGSIFTGFSKDEGLQGARAEGEEKPAKVFKTRVYDLEDVRSVAKKMLLEPKEVSNTLSKEERERVGRWGEEFVYAYLKRKLEAENEKGAADSEKRVVWVNEFEETGFQYDLRVEDATSGEVEAYIEVKATKSKEKHLFEMSYLEWAFAQKEGNKFVIFRVQNAGREDVEICSITNPFRQWKDLNLGMCLSF